MTKQKANGILEKAYNMIAEKAVERVFDGDTP